MRKKSIILALLIFITTLLSVFSFASCTIPVAAKKETLMGTYELTTHTRQRKGEESPTDFIAQGEKQYIVLNENGTGYYLFEDKDTPLYCVQIAYTLTESGDKKNETAKEKDKLYSQVCYYDGQGSAESPSKLKVHATKKATEIMFEQDFYDGLIIHQNVQIRTVFTKVDKDQTLSYVQNVFRRKINSLPMDEYKKEGTYCRGELPNIEDSEYVYKFFDLDMYNKTATYYFMYRADRIRQKSAAYPVTFGENTLSFDGMTYTYDDYGNLTDEEGNGWDFHGARRVNADIEQYIEQYEDSFGPFEE